MTAEQRLAIPSEFRLTYWDVPHECRSYTVRRGRGECAELWGVYDGCYVWDGTQWAQSLWGPDASLYGLDEALDIAESLAREMNMVLIHQLEKRFPGQFRGSIYDLSAVSA